MSYPIFAIFSKLNFTNLLRAGSFRKPLNRTFDSHGSGRPFVQTFLKAFKSPMPRGLERLTPAPYHLSPSGLWGQFPPVPFIATPSRLCHSSLDPFPLSGPFLPPKQINLPGYAFSPGQRLKCTVAASSRVTRQAFTLYTQVCVLAGKPRFLGPILAQDRQKFRLLDAVYNKSGYRRVFLEILGTVAPRASPDAAPLLFATNSRLRRDHPFPLDSQVYAT